MSKILVKISDTRIIAYGHSKHRYPYLRSNIFKKCRYHPIFFGYLLSIMFDLNTEYNKNRKSISMCWKSISNNIKIDIYNL